MPVVRLAVDGNSADSALAHLDCSRGAILGLVRCLLGPVQRARYGALVAGTTGLRSSCGRLRAGSRPSDHRIQGDYVEIGSCDRWRRGCGWFRPMLLGCRSR